MSTVAARATQREEISGRFSGLLGAAIILAGGAVGYGLFPDDLLFLTSITAFALLVLSLDLVVGYAGIATLGQSVMFGAGAYAAGIACVRGLTEPLALLAIGAVAGALAGALSGVVIARAHGLSQLVLSIALVQLAREGANKASFLTGGSDGLSGVAPGPVLGLFQFDIFGRTGFVLGILLLALVFAVLARFVRSPFGLLCRGIKEDPARIEAMGRAPYPALIKMYAVSGAIAGLGGALLAVSTGVVGLDSVSFDRSAEALVMLVLGGIGTLWGALVGTVVFQIVEHIVSAENPFHWLTLMGLLLIAVVLFLPGGLQASVGEVARLLRGRRPVGGKR
ncbi:branched-chain amino acid ABC transporter permease [Chelatococcus sp. GCM10030263]|uniref:branched-chain amino acid ABC transporter permease n=1 Tax=Chelatococcus sp. GCM10030263 TaxID=3273387 RepID=UPI003607A2CC